MRRCLTKSHRNYERRHDSWALSRLLPHQTGGTADRFENRTIAGTAAKVAIHITHNLGVGRFGALLEKRLGRQDHSRRAEAALKSELIEECLLDGVKPFAVTDPLDRRDPSSAGFISKVRARAHGQVVNERRTSTAYLHLARNLQSGQVAPVSENLSQGFLGFEIELDRFAVQNQLELHELDSFPAGENWPCKRSANCAKSSFARRRIGAAPSVASVPVTSTRESMLRSVPAEEAFFNSAQIVPERRFCPCESAPLSSA